MATGINAKNERLHSGYVHVKLLAREKRSWHGVDAQTGCCCCRKEAETEDLDLMTVKRLKSYTRRGIPDRHRHEAWELILDHWSDWLIKEDTLAGTLHACQSYADDLDMEAPSPKYARSGTVAAVNRTRSHSSNTAGTFSRLRASSSSHSSLKVGFIQPSMPKGDRTLRLARTTSSPYSALDENQPSPSSSRAWDTFSLQHPYLREPAVQLIKLTTSVAYSFDSFSVALLTPSPAVPHILALLLLYLPPFRALQMLLLLQVMYPHSLALAAS